MAAAGPKIADVLPHGELRQVFDDIFVVDGTADMGGPRIQRLMTVIRNNGELTLINAVRLNDAGLTKLDALGAVKNVMKLGAFHGMDDAFYVQKYNAKYWVLEDQPPEKLNGVTADVRMNERTKLPFPNTTLHTFKAFTKPEAVLRMDRDGGILIACDAIQNITSTKGANFIGARIMNFFGFVHPMNIGPGLVTANKRGPDYTGRHMWEDFQDIDKLEWSNFVPAHGEPVVDGSAHAKFSVSLRDRWGPEKLNSRYDPMAYATSSLKTKVLIVAIAVVAIFLVWYLRGHHDAGSEQLHGVYEK